MPKLHVPPARTPGTVRFQCSSGITPRQPSADALDGSISPTAANVSGQFAKSELPAPARHPLAQWNQSASVPPQIATVSRFEELVAEADALLDNLKTVQPVKAEEPDDIVTALASKRQQAASRNKLAIVRVRVSLPLCSACSCDITWCFLWQQQRSCIKAKSAFLSAKCCTLPGHPAIDRAAHARHCNCTTQKHSCTSLAQVAGKTFGVPAALARRIAVYSDNATKQLQLDRQCRAYEKQRRLRVSRPAEDIDHVLLNKAAIVLPAMPLTGTMHAQSLLIIQLHWR